MRASRFYLLLCITLVAGAALVALNVTEERAVELAEGAVVAFPLLAEDPDAAARIVITNAAGQFALQRSAAASLWLLPDQGGYPAETASVGKLLNGLAAMTLFAAKTAQTEDLDLLDLAGPASGPRIQVLDAAGMPLVDAVIGKQRENLGRVGVVGTYLRYSDADQAWLALGAPVLPRSALATLNQTLLRLPGSVIARVEVTPPDGGAALLAQRPKRAQQSYVLEPPPVSGGGVDQAALRRLADGLQLLVFDDVRPAEDLPFDQPWRAVFTSFDGIEIALTFIQHQGALWARVSAKAVTPPGDQAKGPRDDAAAFAAELAHRSDGWVFRLNPQLFASLAKRRASVLTAPSE